MQRKEQDPQGFDGLGGRRLDQQVVNSQGIGLGLLQGHDGYELPGQAGHPSGKLAAVQLGFRDHSAQLRKVGLHHQNPRSQEPLRGNVGLGELAQQPAFLLV